MSIAHLLEDFRAFAADGTTSISEVALEEQRLEAFEKGYQAGWDDSAKSQADDLRRVSADLAQNLHEMSFTYQEAYAAILKSLAPLLRQMVDAVLPKAAQATLGTRLVEMLSELAHGQGNAPVRIVTAAANVPAIETMLSDDFALPVSVMAEPSLAEGQVYVRVGDDEQEIDLTEVLDEIDRVVTGFLDENHKEIA